MNKEKTAKILHKIITAHTSLSNDDWMVILNDWGTKDKFDPLFKHKQWSDKPLFSVWGHHMSSPVFFWIVDEHGKDVLLAPTGEDEKIIAHDIVMAQIKSSNYSNSEIITKIFNVLSDDEANKLLDDLVEDRSFKNAKCMGLNLTSWEGSLKHAAFLINYNQLDSLNFVVERNPQVLKDVFNGRTLASMMCTSPNGWDKYLELGGTIFDPVFINPQTNEQLDKPVPLWLWLIQSKNFHVGVKDTLNSLLTRIVEDRPPHEGELVISDEDWQTLLENKEIIQKEISLIMFEIEVNEDWKLARKTNKAWRDWRSNEGATFMHWLASNQVTDFARSQYKIKLNYPLMKTRDDNGNDITSYIFVGLITNKSTGWKRQHRFMHEVFPETMKNLYQNKIIDLHPKKGVVSQLLSASGASFFQRLSHHHNLVSHHNVKEYAKSFTYESLWNGLDSSVGTDLFLSGDHVKRLGSVITELFTHSVEKYGDRFTNMFKNMDNDVKLQILTAMISGNSGNFSYHIMPVYNELLDDCLRKDSNIPLESIDAMLTFVEQVGSRYYSTPESVKKLSAYFSSQSMKKNIEIKQNEKKQMLEESNVEPQVTRKRKRLM